MSEEGLQVSVSLPLYSPSISIDVCTIKLKFKNQFKKELVPPIVCKFQIFKAGALLKCLFDSLFIFYYHTVRLEFSREFRFSESSPVTSL